MSKAINVATMPHFDYEYQQAVFSFPYCSTGLFTSAGPAAL